MVLTRLFIGSLWNTGLILGLTGLKRLLQGWVSLRFQYRCWLLLLVSLLLPLLPGEIWGEWTVDRADRQVFSISDAADMASETGKSEWLTDAVELVSGTEEHGTATAIGIWLAGILVMAFLYSCGSMRLGRIWKLSVEPPENVLKKFRACCQRLSVTRRVEVRQSEGIASPVSFGWRTAYILLPKEAYSEEELEYILLHELTHICHGDHRTNHLFCYAQAVYWFHPLVWLGFRYMRRDREAYCDWEVMNGLGGEAERIGYGRTILRFAERRSTGFHMASGLSQSGKQLKYRLERIVDFQMENRGRRTLGRCLAGLLTLVCLGQIPVLAKCTENGGEYYYPPKTLSIAEEDWGAYFGGRDGCAVVYDWISGQYTVYNKEEITHRIPPCSTYKIYSALNALEQGVITPTENTLEWDGTEREFASWNRDHTLRSAMKDSVNWYFQDLDRTAGSKQLETFYREIGYGNGNLGTGGVNYANGSGLKISALEQVELLVKLYGNDLGFQDANITAVMDSISLNENGLYGKTGTGRLDDANIAGWFVGIVETADNTYFIAVYLNSTDGADGALAYEVASQILKDMNIIE